MCPNEEYLSAYLDHEITPPWDKLLAAHLESCATCRERLASLQTVSAFLKKEDVSDIAEESRVVRARLTATLERRAPRTVSSPSPEERHVPFWRRRVLIPMPVFSLGFLALLVLVASLFFLLGKNGGDLIQARTDLRKLQTVHVYYPVQNPDQLLKMLQDKNMNEEVVIQLPETDSFHMIGEPEVIYVKDSR